MQPLNFSNECHTIPVHNSVKIKNSAMPFSDSSAPIEAALRNWTMLGWPRRRFWYIDQGKMHQRDMT